MYTKHKLPATRWIAGFMTVIGLLLTPAFAAAGTLPDNRAWEMVSPLNKGGGAIPGINVLGSGGIMQSSVDGNAVTYVSQIAFPLTEPKGAPSVNQYIAKRGTAGWSNENITAATGPGEYGVGGNGGPYKAFSETLSSALLELGKVPLAEGEPASHAQYHVRDSATGVFQGLLPSTAFEGVTEALFSATPDLQHVVISIGLAHGGDNLYEWSAATKQFEAINILPGVTTGETVPATGSEFQSHVVSDDGSRVFWESATVGSAALYERENIGTPQAETVQVDAAEEGAPGPGGQAEFLTASSDGSRVFFLDRNRLTRDSTSCAFPGYGCQDLYEFDVDTGGLRDLSVDPHPSEPEGGARVRGVLGASADGSYVYFVATGALPQAQASASGQSPVSGADNLYVSHDGVLRFIAYLSGEDESGLGLARDWNSDLYLRTTRVSDDGSKLLFMSQETLTGYDNTHAGGGGCENEPRCEEVYLYDAGTGRISCVSCNPSGAQPTGNATIPGGDGISLDRAIYQPRVLSEGLPGDGARVFFNSPDALSSQDTNGREDVYEWEQPGVGSCTTSSAGFSATSGGCVNLISGGTYNDASSFIDASVTGDNVFFITGQQLVSQDTDELVDLYDARENGGITVPPTPPVCSGTGCQGVPPAPPIFATPSSVTFNGEGNFAAPGAPKPAVKPKALKRAQKLAVALRACRAKHGRARTSCDKAARRKDGAVGRRK